MNGNSIETMHGKSMEFLEPPMNQNRFMGIHGELMGSSWEIHGEPTEIHRSPWKFMETHGNSWEITWNSRNPWEFMETDSGEVDGNQWICVQASADLVRRGYGVAGDTAENRSEVGWAT